jgi:hypothetical protein
MLKAIRFAAADKGGFDGVSFGIEKLFLRLVNSRRDRQAGTGINLDRRDNMQTVDAGIEAPGKWRSDIQQTIDMIANSEMCEEVFGWHLHGFLRIVAVSWPATIVGRF